MRVDTAQGGTLLTLTVFIFFLSAQLIYSKLGAPDGSGGIYLESRDCVNPAIGPQGGLTSLDDKECPNSGDRRELEIATAAGTAMDRSLNKSGAKYAR